MRFYLKHEVKILLKSLLHKKNFFQTCYSLIASVIINSVIFYGDVRLRKPLNLYSCYVRLTWVYRQV